MILNIIVILTKQLGSSVAQSVKTYLQCRRPGFDLWVRKSPQRGKWQPPPVFLPGKPHGQRILLGYSPRNCKSGTWLSNWITTISVNFKKIDIIFLIYTHVDFACNTSGSHRPPKSQWKYGLWGNIILLWIKSAENNKILWFEILANGLFFTINPFPSVSIPQSFKPTHSICMTLLPSYSY